MGRPRLPKKERRTEPQNTLLRPSEMRELDKLAKQADLSRSVVVRQAICEWLQKHGSEELTASG